MNRMLYYPSPLHTYLYGPVCLRSTSYDDQKEPFHTISYELHPYMSPSMLVLLINFMLLLLFCNLSNGIFGIFTMVVIILLFCLLIELGYSSNPKQNFANSLQTHSSSFYNFNVSIVVVWLIVILRGVHWGE